MSKKTIHLSNALGEIEVDEFEGKVRVLDVPKAVEIYNANSDKEVMVGMKTDSFWTFNTVESEQDIIDYHCPITNWDTPVIEVDGRTIDCYVEIPKHVADTIMNHAKLEAKTMEDIKKFVESAQPQSTKQESK